MYNKCCNRSEKCVNPFQVGDQIFAVVALKGDLVNSYILPITVTSGTLYSEGYNFRMIKYTYYHSFRHGVVGSSLYLGDYNIPENTYSDNRIFYTYHEAQNYLNKFLRGNN